MREQSHRDGGCPHCGYIAPAFDTRNLDRALAEIDSYDFDDPRRRATLRAQFKTLEDIRDQVVMHVDADDAERWVAALMPLVQRIASELAIQEGNGDMGCLLNVFAEHESEAA